jgi:predicted nucleic acid-binding protein
MDEFLRREAEVVGEAPKLEIAIPDEDDGCSVEQAVAGGADVLVTGDRDLVETGEDRPLRILTPRGFRDLLRSLPYG